MEITAKRNLLVMLILVLVSAAIRLYHIGVSSYWLDEMVSVHFASHSDFNYIFLDNAPPFYHLVLKFWIRWLGDSEVATRSLSALFSVLGTTYLTFWVGRRRGTLAALIVGSLHAFSCLSVFYAQETRMYALFELACILNFTAFLDCLEKKELSTWYTGSVAFLAAIHYLAVVPVVVEALIFLWAFEVKHRKKILVTVAIFLGLAGLSLVNFFSLRHLDWQKLKFEVEPWSWVPRDLFWSLVGQSWAGALGFLVLLFAGFRKQQTIDRAFVIFSFGIPLAFTLAALVLRRAMVNERYLMFVEPAWILGFTFWAHEALSNTKWRRYAIVSIGLILGGTVTQGLPGVFRQVKAPWRDMAQEVAKESASVVLTTRTLAIESPYFKRVGIPVLSWNPFQNGTEKIKTILGDGKTVWILDNYWGGVTYFEAIKTDLSAAGINYETITLKTKYSEPVLALRIPKQ